MAARWKITSGRPATSFSAAPGTAKSPDTVSTAKPAFSGFFGSTTSCMVSFEMSLLPSRPSRSSRSQSLQPTKPAAPRIRLCKSSTPSYWPGAHRSWRALKAAARSFLHGAGHRGHIMLHEEGVKDDERQRAGQGSRHQRTPAVDVTVHELVHDRDRHRLVAGRLQERQRVDELVPAQREADVVGRYQAGAGVRQHDHDQDLF